MIVFLADTIESPIEAALAEALMMACAHYAHSPHTLEVRAQHPIGRYRADFALRVLSADGAELGRMVVEADGREFHDVERDAKRDADLDALGWPTHRYTGSAIHANAAECAADVVQWLAWYTRPKAAQERAA